MKDDGTPEASRSFALATHPVHLGLGARIERLTPMDGMAWYERYETATAADGAEGRLVSVHTFHERWSAWEMHPDGDELLFVVSGRMTLIQRVGGQDVAIALESGQSAINPRGVWHTADTSEKTTVLFITAGRGTEHGTSPR